jgi:hypothetical protein
MAVTADKPAPYAPPSAILEIIERYRSRGLPSPINAEVLGRAGVSESLIPRTLHALQTLDLIDETGKPTPTFEGIRLAPEAEYKKRLEDWLKGAYADVFSFVDPAKDDAIRIRDAFRSYQPLGQQDRMVILFQGLCVAAGLIVNKVTPPRPAGTATRPRPATPPPIKRGPSNPNPKASISSPALPPALAGLMTSLPSREEGWTLADRKKFLDAFSALLDFCIPIIESETREDEEDGEEQRASG